MGKWYVFVIRLSWLLLLSELFQTCFKTFLLSSLSSRKVTKKYKQLDSVVVVLVVVLVVVILAVVVVVEEI